MHFDHVVPPTAHHERAVGCHRAEVARAVPDRATLVAGDVLRRGRRGVVPVPRAAGLGAAEEDLPVGRHGERGAGQRGAGVGGAAAEGVELDGLVAAALGDPVQVREPCRRVRRGPHAEGRRSGGLAAQGQALEAAGRGRHALPHGWGGEDVRHGEGVDHTRSVGLQAAARGGRQARAGRETGGDVAEERVERRPAHEEHHAGARVPEGRGGAAGVGGEGGVGGLRVGAG